MNALNSNSSTNTLLSEGWQRISKEIPDITKTLRLPTILERAMRVFLTTTSHSLTADIEGALFQLGTRLNASAACVYLSGNHQEQRKPVFSLVSVTPLPALEDFLFEHWEEVGMGICQRDLQDAQSTTLCKKLSLSMQADHICIIPILHNIGTTGVMILAFPEKPPQLNERVIESLRAFAQLCYLVSERLHMVSSLEERGRLLRRTERMANIGSWYDDLVNDVVTFTPQTASIFDVDDRDIASIQEFFNYVHKDDKERVFRVIKESIEKGQSYELVYRIVSEKGVLKYIQGRGEVVRNNDGEVISRAGSLQDVTDQHLREHRLRLAMTVFEATMEGVIITDANGMVEAINPAFSNITGYSEREVIGKSMTMFKSGRHTEDFYRDMQKNLIDNGYWRGEMSQRRKNGQLYPQWLTITQVKDEQQKISHYVGIFSDISRMKESEEQLKHLANYDSLTNLPNRKLLVNRLSGAINEAHLYGRRIAVLAIDLDHFKHINDSLGHPAGDRLLQEFANRMRKRLRDNDTVARQGGDDFVVILENIISEEQVSRVAKIILELLRCPFDVGVGQELHITASVGITMFPDHGSDVTQLLSNADVAMYQAKKHGRNHFEFYNNDMTQIVADRLELGNQLRVALQSDKELQLYYQPQVMNEGKTTVGVEALLRWHHPVYGLVSPARFIPVAEDNGMMPEIDAWVLQSACQQIALWQDAKCAPITVAVNISQPTFMAGGLVERLIRLLDKTGIDPGWLELEITEGALLEPTSQVLNTISGLKKLGVMLAVDDFGTGYSSLAYLHRYQVDKLKIDRSFVQSAEKEEEGQIITKTIINMARGLGLKVIAEGVETLSQMDFLRDNGCDTYQGFYFSRPVPPLELKLDSPLPLLDSSLP